MKSKLLLGVAMASCAFFAAGAHAATLDLTYWNGSMFGNASGLESCSRTGLHALRHNADDPIADGQCWVTIPLSLKPGTTVQQVTVFYTNAVDSTETSGRMEISLGRIDPSMAETEDYAAYYESIAYQDVDISNEYHAGAQSYDLLTPERAHPGYQDGFVVADTGIYGVGIGLSGIAGFHGIRVTYNDAAPRRGSMPARGMPSR